MGISSKPSECKDNKSEDRIQIHYQTFPGVGLKFFDEGDTTVHEVGHWLGLYHYDPTPAPTEFPTKLPTRKPSHSPSISTSNPTILRAISPPFTSSTSNTPPITPFNTLPNTSNMPPNTPNSSNQGCGIPFIKFFKKMKLNNTLYRIMIHD